MPAHRWALWGGVIACTLGCNAITGLNDLEKVDCTSDCGGTGGASGAGGAAGGGNVPFSVYVGRKGSCAVFTDKSLWCWGANPGSQPGTVATTPARVAGLSNVKAVSLGLEHTCAVDDTGNVWCWGLNSFGQLGDGTNETSIVPKVVAGLPAIDSVSAGANHTCAYTAPDTPPVQMFCWGQNSDGQLGDGTTTDSPVPKKLQFGDGAPILRLSTGDSYTCAVVDVSGTFEIRCWGKNDKGQCGLDPSANPVVPQPTKVPGLPPVERVYPGSDHMCTRTVGTRIPWCWGANDHGQVGTNTTSPWEPPSLVVGASAIDTMSPGARHTCLTVKGSLEGMCWGANDKGQFSGNPGSDQPLPTAEPALDGVGFSMRQAEHGCGVFGTVIKCWGANDSGQVGNGETGVFSPAFQLTFTP